MRPGSTVGPSFQQGTGGISYESAPKIFAQTGCHEELLTLQPHILTPQDLARTERRRKGSLKQAAVDAMQRHGLTILQV